MLRAVIAPVQQYRGRCDPALSSLGFGGTVGRMKVACGSTSWIPRRLVHSSAAWMLRHRGGMAALGALLLLGVGCGGGARKPLDPLFLDRAEAVELARQGMEAPHPDERRAAVARLAESRWVGDPDIVRTLGLIAESDRSPTVQTVAVVALGRSETRDACTASAALLPEENTPPDRVSAESVRTETLHNLEHCVALGLLSPADTDAARRTGMRLLTGDLSRNVRLAAARLLRHFQRREVLVVLISALEQRDFGVCHEAERSLEHLTGRRFDHDPVAWRAYLLQTDQPFAVAASGQGQADEDTGWFDWLKPKS